MWLRWPRAFKVLKQEHCYRGNVAVSGSRFAISRRDSASHTDEIIIRLNWIGGATFTFLSLKRVNLRANSGSALWRERPCTSVSGLQFFTISVFKPRCDQLKVLTRLRLSSRTRFVAQP